MRRVCRLYLKTLTEYINLHVLIGPKRDHRIPPEGQNSQNLPPFEHLISRYSVNPELCPVQRILRCKLNRHQLSFTCELAEDWCIVSKTIKTAIGDMMRRMFPVFCSWLETKTMLALIKSNRDGVRKAREAYLIDRGQTLEPLGLNRRDETIFPVFYSPFLCYFLKFLIVTFFVLFSTFATSVKERFSHT